MSRARRWTAAVGHQPAWWVLAVAVPLVVVLGRLAGRGWHLTGDYSHTELMTRSIPSHLPLTGVVGRFGTPEEPGAHPGPSMAYAMWPVYRLLGSSSWGMMVATALLHMVGAAAAVAVARRTGGRGAALLVLVAVAVLVRAQGIGFFLAPWNVWVPFFAFLAFVMTVWGLVRADLRLAPWAVLLGSHAAQTHIGYVPLVVGMLALVLGWLMLRAWRTGEPSWARLGQAIGWSSLVGALMWLPPVLDQLRHRPGNLRILARHFLHPPAPPVGVRAGVKGFLGEYDLVGTWWRGGDHDPLSSPFWPGVVALFALAGLGVVLAVRRRDRAVLELQATVGAAVLIGLVATTRIVGDFYSYVIRWTWVLAALTVTASAWSIARAVAECPPHGARLRPLVSALVAVAVAVPAAWTMGEAVTADGPAPRDSALVGSLASLTEPGLRRDARYLVRWHDPAGLSSVPFGLLLQWEKDGEHVGVDAPWGAAAQRWRVMDEARTDGVLWVVGGDANISTVRTLGYPELGVADVRTPAERAESDMLRGRITAALVGAGRADLVPLLDAQYGLTQLRLFHRPELSDSVYVDVVRYAELRLPTAVFLFPPCAVLTPTAPIGADNPAQREDCEARRSG